MTLREIYAARQRVARLVRRTPLAPSPWLSALTGAEVRLKLESAQVTHSFKARGACNAAVVRREAWQRDGGPVPRLVTASAGNHGRALAFAAEQVGLPLVVFTPSGAPRTKLDHIARHGAELRAVAPTYEDAERLAQEYATTDGAEFISPYSHPDVIAGAATVALEILEDWPEADTLVASVGGGGLVSGVGIAVKAIAPSAEVIGVEAAASPAFTAALAAGRPVWVDVAPTVADGLAGNMDPGTLTFDYVQRLVDRIVLAPEPAILGAIRGLAAQEHVIAEGAGAAAVAGLLETGNLSGRKVAVVISGANIDMATLAAVLRAP
jgi:threonine dehydratase